MVADNESPEKASDKDAESFAKAMGNAVERTSKAHAKSSEIQAKTKNMSREKDWKNKTRTYANASNFATSDEDWAARAGGYGADLIAQAKAQQDAAADSQKAQLDQVNKMVEEAEKATKAEKVPECPLSDSAQTERQLLFVTHARCYRFDLKSCLTVHTGTGQTRGRKRVECETICQ